MEATLTAETVAPTGDWKTSVWDGKFLYGAYSTLMASWTLFQNPAVIGWLQDPQVNQKDLDFWLPELLRIYNGYDYATFEAVRISATGNHGTSSIFEECRDFCLTAEQNSAFIAAMAKYPNLKPVDNYYDVYERDLLQLNVHRGLYHSAYGIPQNSMASVFNAYLAGIRSVEFDVLESKDFENLVIHDLVTNRLDASFDDPPRYVAKWNANAMMGTKVGILDPLQDTPTIRQTEVQNLIRTRDLLWAVRRWMPEVTLYADARNSAPISLFKLLYDEPELAKNLVIKIYPFELAGGAYDVVVEYARRYTSNDHDEAIRQIRKVDANLLLAIGGLPNELSERTSLSTLLGIASTLEWDSKGVDGERITTYLPFTMDSKLKPANWPNYNQPWDLTLFSDEELRQVQARTFLVQRWALDFSALGEVRVLQIGLLPSLTQLIDANNRAAFDAIPTGQRLSAAVFDNLMWTFYAAMQNKLDLTIVKPNLKKDNIKDLWHRAAFGGSDRYPDFAFAERNADGSVNQETLQHFYYSMLGVVYQKDDYGARNTRSTEAVCDAIVTWPHIQKPGDRGGYLTTDLPIDLRTMEMALAGTNGFPLWMHYRVGGMVKAKFNPDGKFVPKTWSTQLWGKLRREQPGFSSDYDAISAQINLRKGPALALDSIEAFYQCPDVLVNRKVLVMLDDAGWRVAPLGDQQYIDIVDRLKAELFPIEQEILKLQKAFAAKYSINYDGTPVLVPLEEILLLPDANWDH